MHRRIHSTYVFHHHFSLNYRHVYLFHVLHIETKKKQNKNTQREGEKTRTRNENTHRFKLDNGNRLHKFFSLHLEEGGFAMACYCLCHGMPCNCFASNFDGICKIPPNLHC